MELKLKKPRYKKNLQKDLMQYTRKKDLLQCESKGCIFVAKHIYYFSEKEFIKLCSSCDKKLGDISTQKRGKNIRQEVLKKWQKKK